MTVQSKTVLRLAVYYFLLYFFTVVYNVANKRVLNEFPLPATVAAIQTMLGIPLFLPIWLYKWPKNLKEVSMMSLAKVSLSHSLGNLATVYSLGSGSVSFTHVIKAAEPIFSAIFSAVLMKSYFPIEVYAALLPIVFGVGLASATELTFTYFGFTMGMMSNFFYQLRIVLSKQLIETKVKKLDENGSVQQQPISSADLFRIITVYSTIQLLIIALLLEGNVIIPTWNTTLSRGSGGSGSPGPNSSSSVTTDLVVNIIVSGFSYYLYNEISFWILDLVHPITHAVGNTIKRVVLIIASIVIFHIPMSFQGGIGSVIAIFGSFLYAVAAQRYAAVKSNKNVGLMSGGGGVEDVDGKQLP